MSAILPSGSTLQLVAPGVVEGMWLKAGPKGIQGDPGVVQTIVAGTAVNVDDTDPAYPVVSVDAEDFATAEQGTKADTAVQPDDLADVATTGAYSDLLGAPSLSTVATTGAYSDLLGAPVLATVATTGAYSDLTGRPTLGTAAAQDTGDFATAAQGTKADTAVQPADLGILKGGDETVSALSATTGTCTANLNLGRVFTISPTGNWTLAFSNVPASRAVLVTIIVSEGGAARDQTQPANTTPGKGGYAIPAANKWRILNYLTVDGGANWRYSFVEQD